MKDKPYEPWPWLTGRRMLAIIVILPAMAILANWYFDTLWWRSFSGHLNSNVTFRLW